MLYTRVSHASTERCFCVEYPLSALENLPSRLPKSAQLWLPPFFDGNQTLVFLWFTSPLSWMLPLFEGPTYSSQPFALCTNSFFMFENDTLPPVLRSPGLVHGVCSQLSPCSRCCQVFESSEGPLRFKGPKWVWDCLVVPPYLSLAFLSFLWYQVEANEGRLSLSPNDLQLLTTDASEPRKMVRSCSRCQWPACHNDCTEGDQMCFSIAALELKNLSSSGSRYIGLLMCA